MKPIWKAGNDFLTVRKHFEIKSKPYRDNKQNTNDSKRKNWYWTEDSVTQFDLMFKGFSWLTFMIRNGLYNMKFSLKLIKNISTIIFI